MFIITAKVPSFKGGSPMAMASVICSLAILFGLSKEPFQEAMWARSDSSPSAQNIKNEKEARSYVEELGWVVEETPLGVQTLLVPEVLDESYEGYIQLQVSQGFTTLEEVTGEQVTQYRFRVLNHPTGEEGVQVNILCYENTVIGGEVLSPQVGGFLHGLSMPSLTRAEEDSLSGAVSDWLGEDSLI